jgi:hypothetical protein
VSGSKKGEHANLIYTENPEWMHAALSKSPLDNPLQSTEIQDTELNILFEDKILFPFIMDNTPNAKIEFKLLSIEESFLIFKHIEKFISKHQNFLKLDFSIKRHSFDTILVSFNSFNHARLIKAANGSKIQSRYLKVLIPQQETNYEEILNSWKEIPTK